MKTDDHQKLAAIKRAFLVAAGRGDVPAPTNELAALVLCVLLSACACLDRYESDHATRLVSPISMAVSRPMQNDRIRQSRCANPGIEAKRQNWLMPLLTSGAYQRLEAILLAQQ